MRGWTINLSVVAVIAGATFWWGSNGAIEELEPGYPAGKWRLSDPAELDRTVLWLSHILVRYGSEGSGIVALSNGDWTHETRDWGTRKSAFERATELHQHLLAEPSLFEQLARERSDDPVTAALGGSLGAVIATELTTWPSILDAVAALTPGDISRVVESPLGFHIIKLRYPPPRLNISGRRIVIGYDGANWLDVVGRPHRESRSYNAAAQLARELVQRLRAGEIHFDEALSRFSDHHDIATGGAIGEWSTHEPSILAREVEILSKTPMLGITDPVDTFVGWTILQRITVQKETVIPVTIARFPFDSATPESRENAWELAQLALQGLDGKLSLEASHPELVADESWQLGRIDAQLFLVAKDLVTGKCSTVPIELNYGFAVFCVRFAESSQSYLPPLLRLPAPSIPDLHSLFERADARMSQELVNTMLREGVRRTEDTEETQPELERLHRTFLSELESVTDRKARATRLDDFLWQLKRTIGATDFETYLAHVHTAFSYRLLGRRP
jgi:hypothetical protein